MISNRVAATGSGSLKGWRVNTEDRLGLLIDDSVL